MTILNYPIKIADVKRTQSFIEENKFEFEFTDNINPDSKILFRYSFPITGFSASCTVRNHMNMNGYRKLA